MSSLVQLKRSVEAKPRRVYFVSLGCPKNQVDTEVMLGVVGQGGHELVDDPEDADTLVVNTCGFIEEAKEESIDAILELAQAKAEGAAAGRSQQLVVTGCLSQRYSEELAVEMPEVDHFLGSADMQGLARVLQGTAPRLAVSELDRRSYLYDHTTARQVTGRRHSAYVKIGEGCDRPCAFCIIPKLRGPQRSRAVESLVHEVEQLVAGGACVSLIGDPSQGIYEFAGADGRFLADYGSRPGVVGYGLTRNYRSVPAILALANRVSARTDVADRGVPVTSHGPFFISYKTADQDKLVETFQAAVVAAGLEVVKSAVLCRARSVADRLAGKAVPVGQGIVKNFVLATLCRDRRRNYLDAFELVAGCISGLLADPPHGLVAQITQPSRYPATRPLCRLIWSFTRDAATGLPSSGLLADTQWHPLLLARVKALLATLERDHGLKPAEKLGNKLAKRDLPNAPLMSVEDLAGDDTARLRIDTVHQVKGESLDAVLYVATKDHVVELLAGVNTEVGRIGYVAITRARNLLWLGVPANALKELRPALVAHGFTEVGNV